MAGKRHGEVMDESVLEFTTDELLEFLESSKPSTN